MKQILSILLIAVSSNLDNIGVGTSYGIRKINIPITSNLLIAAVTATGTFLSVLFGQSVYLLMSRKMAGLLGGAIIVLTGLWVICRENFMHPARVPREGGAVVQTGRPGYGFNHIVQILNNPIAADWDFSGHIDLKEATALALGLTINNIPNGVGSGVLGLNIYAMTAVVFLLSIIAIWVGIYLGQFGLRWVRNSAGVLAGLALIFVGCYELFS